MSLRPSPRASALRFRSRRAATAVLVAAVAASLALAGCGGSSSKGSDGVDPQSTEGGTQLNPVQPLTGEKVSGELPKHPVMFVKIDNSSASDPQINVGKADMVFQELVEGGYTRLAAAFYSTLPRVAGPVRSARSTDVGIVLPTAGVLVASGSAPKTVRRLQKAGVNFKSLDQGSPGIYRDAGDTQHDYLHSVFVDLPKLAKSVGAVAPPSAYLPWGSEEDFAGVTPAKNVTVRFSGNEGSTTTFNFKNGKYEIQGGFMDPKSKFTPDTVLVLRVKTGDAGYRDPAGNFVPESLFFGKGNALLFHNGQLVRGTWTKAERGSALELTTVNGELRVPPGKVWVALLPNKEGSPKVTFK